MLLFILQTVQKFREAAGDALIAHTKTHFAATFWLDLEYIWPLKRLKIQLTFPNAFNKNV